ncbi:clathrin assembly protein, putative [Ricinus communis]|uniref:Clathrin assembly protein, putative n=1 Tax=Ricinus communis TaxID=3988 RepID=B9SCP6_RICCO|nr:clathrin assembly protein, putative [Ricinus communis]|eukprot:XP_002523765.1 putative clathrin assembly protein At1g03050 [Ricinus communis]
MAPSKIRRALGAVKDQTSIGLAKVGSSNSLSDLDVAIVKATRHEEYPAEERHVREILSLTSYSRAYISACVNTLSRRLNKTRNWTVALKTLVLIQRLLGEGDPAYEQEIFFATRRGTRLLNMSDFCDTSRSNSWDYSAFVRTYALYLDERLEYRMQGRRGRRSAFGIDEDEEATGTICVRSTPVREMKTDHVFSRIQHLQQLLERFLACRPTGGAKHNRVVIVALYPIVKESFQLYYDITEILGILIDRFMELEISDSVKVYDIFCRISKQFEDLESFYGWCKIIGIGRSSDYPDVEKITPKKLDLMDEFIRDKSALAQTKHAITFEEMIHETEEGSKQVEENEDDMTKIKALPPPEGFPTEEIAEEEVKEGDKEENNTTEVDLLNLGEELVSTEEYGTQLALALFDGGAQPGATTRPPWEAFNDDSKDWETTLVQSASHLSNQKATLAGGFDMMLLDGMYQRGATNAATSAIGYGGSGSASSVALESTGRPTMLALPPPPTQDGNNTVLPNADPFAASLVVAPPPYVQMSDMEKKQKLLVEEQLMWQQYARDGMQGQVGITKLQPNSYNMGGYTSGY